MNYSNFLRHSISQIAQSPMDIVTMCLLSILLIFDIILPYPMAMVINNVGFYAILLAVGSYFLLNSSIFVAIAFAIFSYKLALIAQQSVYDYKTTNYIPSESNKLANQLLSVDDNSYTLEQEVIDVMAPITNKIVTDPYIELAPIVEDTKYVGTPIQL